MLSDLRRRCPLHSIEGPIALPGPTPDADLLIADEASSTVLVAELKWIRKTLRPLEMTDRDAEVVKGINQLRSIREFLAKNPAFLVEQRKLPRPLADYKRVQYLLIARDHWLWVEPSDGLAIVEFEAFTKSLGRLSNLGTAVDELLTYDWLPVEGPYFRVQYDRATAHGVSIESQVFYAV
jgi:hypothetical protein